MLFRSVMDIAWVYQRDAAEITVRVVKRHERECFTYTDMSDSPAHYAALRLREEGVFSGECFGTEAFFAPEQTVTRAQFLTMAAAVADLAQPVAAVSTGLSDDDSIPAWSRGYVAAGILSGVVEGSDDGSGNRVFRADSAITRAEAAAILDRCLALADDGREMAFSDSGAVPAWSAQSVVNCVANGRRLRASAGVFRQHRAAHGRRHPGGRRGDAVRDAEPEGRIKRRDPPPNAAGDLFCIYKCAKLC